MTSETPIDRDSQLLWQAVQLAGLLFTVIGAVDMATLWFPAHVGTPEWEFGTASAFFDTFPAFGLGLALLMASAVARGGKGTIRAVALVCILVAVFMWAAAALYATVLPFVFRGLRNPVALTAVKKGMAKLAVQALIYPFGLLWLAGMGWRASIRPRGV